MSGLAHYEAVQRGDTRDYCYKLTSLQPGETFSRHVQQLVQAVDNQIDDIESASKRKVIDFVVGKSSWGENGGPGHRWRNFYRHAVYDGMVVICTCTRDLGTFDTNDQPAVHQALYALALQQALTHEYVLNRRDMRCRNQIGSSADDDESSDMGAVYFVFRLGSSTVDVVDAVVDFVVSHDVVDPFLRRVVGDDFTPSSEFAEAVDKYDSLPNEQRRRCAELLRDDEDASSDDNDDVQALVGFVRAHLDEGKTNALLCDSKFLDGALAQFSALSMGHQQDVLERLR